MSSRFIFFMNLFPFRVGFIEVIQATTQFSIEEIGHQLIQWANDDPNE